MRAIPILRIIIAALIGAAPRLWERLAPPGEIEAGAAGIGSGRIDSGDGDVAGTANERPHREDARLDRAAAAPTGARPGSLAAAKPAKSIFYQWVDERGSVHFAASLDEVPVDWRARAGQIELDSPASDPTPPASPRPAPRSRIIDTAPARRAHEVTVYTAPWCGWCRKTLAFLDQRGIDYVNKDIEADADYADELREKTGGTAIPLVEIDGTAIRGFDPAEMTALLD